MNEKNILLIFGFGYTAKFMCQKFSKKNWEVFCTTRFKVKAKEIKALNATPVFFNEKKKIESILCENSYILSTAPPENGKDPVIENYGYLFKKNSERIKNIKTIFKTFFLFFTLKLFFYWFAILSLIKYVWNIWFF